LSRGGPGFCARWVNVRPGGAELAFSLLTPSRSRPATKPRGALPPRQTPALVCAPAVIAISRNWPRRTPHPTLAPTTISRCRWLVGFLRSVFGAEGELQSGAPTEMRIRDSIILITWEFPRLCWGGSRSLTYTAVVLRKTCDGLRHDMMRGGNKPKPKQLRSRMQRGKHRQMGLFSITSVGPPIAR
jgi:hypothetical protein